MNRTLAAIVVRVLAFVGGAVACGAFAMKTNPGAGGVALYWPAAGFALALVVEWGLPWVLLVPLATLLLHLAFAPVPAAFLPFSLLADSAGVLAGAWLARRDPRVRPGTVRYGFQVLCGGTLTALVGGLIGGYGMWRAGMVSLPQLVPTQLRLALADMLGIASLAPAVMMLLDKWRRRAKPYANHPGGTGEGLLWNLALAASFLLMAWGMSLSRTYALGLSALPVAVMLWSALRFSALRTAVSVALTVALIATFAGLGLAGLQPAQRTLEVAILLVYLCLISILPIVLALNVNEQRLVARRLLHRANTDPLTRLLNRGSFEAQARLALRDPAPMALAYLDLDNLKLINDTASHRAGDALIVAVADALRLQMRPGDLLGHLGGDEFIALLHNVTPTIAHTRALALLRAVEDSRCRYGDEELSTTTSMGLVPFQPDHVEFGELLSQADAACFNAKEHGGNRISIAGSAAGAALADPTSRMRWTVRIREALQNDGFLLYAQSIVPLRPELRRGAHFELLLRMRDPQGGPPHTPDRFIPAAERFRLAMRIDREVVRMALAHLQSRPEMIDAVAMCAINLSADTFLDEGFADFVGDRLQRSAFPADRLCFEITETSAMRDHARSQRVIDELRGLGCRFALDDFGTGFCSFSQLRALDVDYIKIDGSFIRDMQASPIAAEVVHSITRIAHVMGKRTIAEHVEDGQQRDALAGIGVDYVQGYAIDRPIPLDDYFLSAMQRHPDAT